MNHTLPVVLQWGKGTTAYFAHSDADKLIVFIHGFGGDAIRTWRGMERLLPMRMLVAVISSFKNRRELQQVMARLTDFNHYPSEVITTCAEPLGRWRAHAMGNEG